MRDLLHDPHLLLNLNIDNAILHELALLNLLRRELFTGELSGEQINGSKSSLANSAALIILGATTPLSWTVGDVASACGEGRRDGITLIVREEIRLTTVNKYLKNSKTNQQLTAPFLRAFALSRCSLAKVKRRKYSATLLSHKSSAGPSLLGIRTTN